MHPADVPVSLAQQRGSRQRNRQKMRSAPDNSPSDVIRNLMGDAAWRREPWAAWASRDHPLNCSFEPG